MIEDDDSSATCSADEGTHQDDFMFHSTNVGSRALPGKGPPQSSAKFGSGDKMVSSSDDKDYFKSNPVRMNNRVVESSGGGGVVKTGTEEDGQGRDRMRAFSEFLGPNKGVNNIRDLIDSAIDKHLIGQYNPQTPCVIVTAHYCIHGYFCGDFIFTNFASQSS